MTDRDMLIELIDKKQYQGNATETGANYIQNSELADYLIANGVIVSPCNVGKMVLVLNKDRVPDDDYRMNFHDEWVLCEVRFQLSMINQIGKTVFITREEAEKALQKMKDRQ